MEILPDPNQTSLDQLLQKTMNILYQFQLSGEVIQSYVCACFFLILNLIN